MKNIVVLVRNASWFSLGIACAAILLFGVAATEAASTINTNLATDGTLSVTGASTLTGAVTAAAAVSVGTDLTVTDDATISDDLTVSGTASSTDLKVGDDQVSTIAGLIHGFCTFTDVTSFTASTTKFVHCASATGVTSSYRVFVQATSSFESSFVIQAASSTSGAISLRVLNTDMDGNNGNATLNGTSINFWAVR